jgi:predicted nucleic acid-binding Zn ribbon protein
MPTYDFENTKTGEVTTEMMSIAELDEFKKNNPHMKQLISKVNIVGGVMGMGRMKTDGGWKDMLSRIGDAHPGSKVHDLYGNKSIKDIKTRQVLQKHQKRQAQQKKGK